MTAAVFAGFQSLLILNLGEFQNFAMLLMVFVELRSKFTNFWEKSWIFSHAHQAFSTGFPVSSIGRVWIYSEIAQCTKQFLIACFIKT